MLRVHMTKAAWYVPVKPIGNGRCGLFSASYPLNETLGAYRHRPGYTIAGVTDNNAITDAVFST
jgi:hypothetical protein